MLLEIHLGFVDMAVVGMPSPVRLWFVFVVLALIVVLAVANPVVFGNLLVGHPVVFANLWGACPGFMTVPGL